MRVLITGGAGFIGTHLTRKLLAENCAVSILDNFSPQVHGQSGALAPDIASKVQLFKGSVTDRACMEEALHGQDVIVHFAAETGTGQSMYEVEKYSHVNICGTALLLDILVNQRPKSTVSKIVVASSRAIYGEGRYKCAEHGLVNPGPRQTERMARGLFEPTCPICAADCTVAATDELSKLAPTSYYGLSKRVQEESVLLFARTLGISAFGLRYQNVYGPGQSLKNPYTGVLAVFSNLARAGLDINIFEDGKESRDFVFVQDVVAATWKCMAPAFSGIDVFNVGSGVGTSVLDVAQRTVEFFRSTSKIAVSGQFRDGDIRHNVADLTKVRSKLLYEPQWSFAAGLNEFLNWTVTQDEGAFAYERSIAELRTRGMMHG